MPTKSHSNPNKFNILIFDLLLKELYITQDHNNIPYVPEEEIQGIRICDKTINVIYQGIGNSANCVCPFDVECLIEGLAFGQYRVLVYMNDMSGLLYEIPIDYAENMPKGTYKPSNGDVAI